MTSAVVNSASGGDLELPSKAVFDFHRKLSGYAPTPLVDGSRLAAEIGIDQLWVKDESQRFGLPAFKFLGASWALARVLGETEPARMVEAARVLGVTRLVAATDGNHGRAVARLARMLGVQATIFVPTAMAPARRAAILSEGADVVVEFNYDAAVNAAARRAADPGTRVINDADEDGASPVPAWIIDGYSTLFLEAATQLAAASARVDLLVIQLGVGASAAAGIRWAMSAGVRVLGVEPTGAACVAASIAAGRVTTIEPSGTSMAGLDCGTPSHAAWPSLVAGLTGVVVIDDDRADAAARRLAGVGVEAGESGAAGLAGLEAVAADRECEGLRSALKWDQIRSVLIINTEGATDPERYARVLAGAV